MERLRQENSVLYEILEKSGWKLLCPVCLKGFPRSDALYQHFRGITDEIHSGLDPTTHNFKRLYLCYQRAVKTLVPAEELSLLTHGGKCFELQFIVQHYGNNVGALHDMPSGEMVKLLLGSAD
jgi:hypothetical protein